MKALSDFVLGHPRAWGLGALVATAASGVMIPRLALRTDGAAIHPPSGPAVRATEADRSRFHDPDAVLVLVSADPGGPRVASVEGFGFLRAIHDSLAGIPGIQANAVRWVGAWPRPESAGSGPVATGALEQPPATEAEAIALAAALRRDPIVRGLLLSDDGKLSALEVPLAPGDSRSAVLHDLEAWAARNSTDFQLALLGPVVAEVQLGERVLADLVRLVPVMMAVIAALLAVALRTPAGVLIPLAEAGAVVAWTLGTMSLMQVPITLVTTIMPVVLVAMAITDEIHLLDRLRARLAVDRDRGHAIRATLHEVGGPIIATSLTTAIGFFSFAGSTLPPLRDFGIYTGIGILYAMLLTFTLVPALAVLLPARWFGRRAGPTLSQPPVEWKLAGRPRAALLAGLVLVALAAAGWPRLRVQDAWVDNFDPRSALVQAERDYNANFWGSYRWDVVLERDAGFFFRPEGVALVERVEAAALAAPGVGGVASALAPLERAARSFGSSARLSSLDGGRLAELVALTQMAHERTGILNFVTPDGSAARVRVHLNSADYERTERLRRELEARLAPLLAGTAWHSSGDLPVALEVVHAIVGSQMRSAGLALAGIALLLLISLRRLDATLVSLVPVSAAAAILFGIMGWTGIPLGIATSMFASLSIGVGVDFGLHMLHHHREARRAGRTHQDAVRIACERTGRAIRWNAVVLSLGLAVLCFSQLRPDRTLGLLLAAAVLACWATTLLFLPALLRALRVVLAVVCLGITITGVARAEPERAHDPAAEMLLRRVESEYRRLPRCVQLRITTRFDSTLRSERTLWSAVDGDTVTTRVLYVFTKPDDLRGMSLLVHDHVDPSRADSTWLYLPAYRDFSRLDAPSQKVMVPGTALTNDDARGFIPAERYALQFADSAGARIVVARPHNVRMRLLTGYDRLRIRIDPRRHLVEQVDFTGTDGRPLKTYEMLDAVEVQGVWLPRRVRIRHLQLGFDSLVEYTYRPFTPPAALFTPSVARETFLPRMERALARLGIGIDAAAP